MLVTIYRIPGYPIVNGYRTANVYRTVSIAGPLHSSYSLLHSREPIINVYRARKQISDLLTYRKYS